ncbi:MAG: DUF6508 domain-containing protein [Balneolaceae bacterium]|nr:DUF6508 domain-containing protein [Balneolaceae bacterium]
MPVKPDELERHLKAISQDDWKRLFDLNNQIEPGMKFGQVKGGDDREDGSFTVHYWEQSEIFQRFHDLVYELGFLIDFDWPDWKEGKELLTNGNQEFEDLDTITLCKLLTTIVRAERFNEGLLVKYFRDGTIPAIIQALKNNLEEGSGD